MLLLLCFYYALTKFPKLEEVDLKFHTMYLIVGLALFPLNWIFEYMKWLNVQDQLSLPIPKKVAFHSFLSGLVSGMLTPNMQGNFIGRMFYFKRRERISIIGLTLLSNFSQLLITLLFGIFAVWYLGKLPVSLPINMLLFPLLLLTIVGFGFYFYGFRFVSRFARFHFFKQLRLLPSSVSQSFLWKNLMWSILRFLVFSCQFLCFLLTFSSTVSADLMVWIWQFYFWVTLAPSLFLGKLVVRESVAVWVLSLAGCATLPVLIASFCIWLINLFLPTVLGLIVLRIPNDSGILSK